jgi:hypothetical protein
VRTSAELVLAFASNDDVASVLEAEADDDDKDGSGLFRGSDTRDVVLAAFNSSSYASTSAGFRELPVTL